MTTRTGALTTGTLLSNNDDCVLGVDYLLRVYLAALLVYGCTLVCCVNQ